MTATDRYRQPLALHLEAKAQDQAMNPNGYSGGDVAQFQDPSPWLEGCDRMRCTAPVGGDHSETCEVSRYRCHWCGRDVSDYPYVNVSLSSLAIVRCCDVCWERGNEGVDIPLDMTEDDDAD